MFKQSRRKILASIMLLLICLFAGILAIIYGSSYRDVSDDSFTMLERYAELYTLEEDSSAGEEDTDAVEPSDSTDVPDEQTGSESTLSEMESGRAEPPENVSSQENRAEDSDVPSDAPDSDVPSDTPDSDTPDSPPDEEDSLPESTPAFRLSTFYTVAVSDDGEILATENTNISYSDAALEEIAVEIINSSKWRGVKGNLIYYIMRKDGYTLAAFMDNTIMQESITTLVRYTLIFGAIAIVLIFFIAILLARKIVSPLEESYQKQKQFISDAGHELKTPIAVVDANAELLSREIGENVWLSNIRYENDRMGSLIQQLLALTHTENTTPPMERMNFSRAVGGEALPFESIAYEKNLRFTCDISNDVYVRGNSIQIKQLTAILLDNALHHCTEKGEIALAVNSEHGSAILSVTNDGQEIPAEHADKIFERFYRVDAARSGEEKRYGLGLAIAKAIVTTHHGSIRVQCGDGKVTFTVSVPTIK
ncbi:MAG: ATP-binding protein [Clostridiales bacterium]|nr:ATP-binding protein [Clostridiales bacterium]